MSWKPIESMEEAKVAAAGPLGFEMSKFPLRFATAILIAPHPSHKGSPVQNGSGSLVQFGERHAVLTCSHVVQGFRDLRSKDETYVFQVGDFPIALDAQLLAEDPTSDVAVIALTDAQVAMISAKQGEFGRL